MKTHVLILVLLNSIPLFANADNISTLEKEAQQKVQQFAKQLQSTLKSGIKQGGLPAGINLCKESANSIALAHSTNGWQLSRTSLKVRNPQNAPDTWEHKQLNAFEEQLKQGKKLNKLQTSDVVTHDDNKKQYRYIKAIPTGEVCLKCHGSNIAPAVKEALVKHYPNDKATGFQLGDIRGAFSLTKPIN